MQKVAFNRHIEGMELLKEESKSKYNTNIYIITENLVSSMSLFLSDFIKHKTI